MADRRTELTELATALGMLRADTLADALSAMPGELVTVGADAFERVREAAAEPELRPVAEAAFANGRAFRQAADGLRGRLPARVEWTGPNRPPGYDLLPADLRVDHVYLVSCKYQSRLLCNVSPAHVFDRLLQVRVGEAAADWYEVVAPAAYDALYQAVRRSVGGDLPGRAADLDPAERRRVAKACARRWPTDVEPAYGELCRAVSAATAARWSAALPTLRRRQELLWRLLRLSDAPYFVLGSADGAPLRLRIATPWDWRQRYRLRSFAVAASEAGQPQVTWEATVEDRVGGADVGVRGHVEVRWSHGRFSGMPEAKVYLDTPHRDVPGYFPLQAVEAPTEPAAAPASAPGTAPGTEPASDPGAAPATAPVDERPAAADGSVVTAVPLWDGSMG